jgi:hypothetical protein
LTKLELFKLQTFSDWLSVHGCTAGKVAIELEDLSPSDRTDHTSNTIQGLGLKASEPIEKDEIVISLPSALHLNLKGSRLESSKLKSIEDLTENVPSALWAIRLAMILYAAKSETGYAAFQLLIVSETEFVTDSIDGFWKAYIELLPRELDIPIFFNAEAIRELQYQPLISQV